MVRSGLRRGGTAVIAALDAVTKLNANAVPITMS
jgi:hypothetical protein